MHITTVPGQSFFKSFKIQALEILKGELPYNNHESKLPTKRKNLLTKIGGKAGKNWAVSTSRAIHSTHTESL